MLFSSSTERLHSPLKRRTRRTEDVQGLRNLARLPRRDRLHKLPHGLGRARRQSVDQSSPKRHRVDRRPVAHTDFPVQVATNFCDTVQRRISTHRRLRHAAILDAIDRDAFRVRLQPCESLDNRRDSQSSRRGDNTLPRLCKVHARPVCDSLNGSDEVLERGTQRRKTGDARDQVVRVSMGIRWGWLDLSNPSSTRRLCPRKALSSRRDATCAQCVIHACLTERCQPLCEVCVAAA